MRECCQTAASCLNQEVDKNRPIIILGFEANDMEILAVGCDLLLDLYTEDPYTFMFDCVNLGIPKQDFSRCLRDKCGCTDTDTEKLYVALCSFVYSRMCRLIEDCHLEDVVGVTFAVTRRTHNAIILETIDNAIKPQFRTNSTHSPRLHNGLAVTIQL